MTKCAGLHENKSGEFLADRPILAKVKWRLFSGAPHAMSGLKASPTLLGDFRTGSRMLVLIGLALPVGAISAVVAKALLWLIAQITNVVFFQRFSSQLGSLQHNHLGVWVILAPVVSALVAGLMARYGRKKFGVTGFLKRWKRFYSAAVPLNPE
jgi:hypothetical protein